MNRKIKKTEHIHIKVTPEFKEMVRNQVIERECFDMSHYITELIKEDGKKLKNKKNRYK